ncbi:class A beta-lactamase [Herminiimonas contaminans]|uniref:Beta-lactamase n=1 Tax=Herminiimonas contaminans TaxID=1111140 RepID=A0ABS0EZ33_9BURK|nr:class A beta-lactamase [Herminiimonas contaminans]MBF8179323.1 class A beta-lactamase [Herminiimonas contaminans]
MLTSSRRRSLLLAAIATPLTGLHLPIHASNQKISRQTAQEELKKIEARSGGRLGVSAINMATDNRVEYRAEERFPFCSTFKVMVAAAILQRSTSDASLLQKRNHYKKEDTDKSGYAPVTQKHLADGMTVSELCAATLQYSDNAAANFLMKELGGPAAITAYMRSIGDNVFRLDRWEPELNTAVPGDERDTSTPAAMESSLEKLALGSALPQAQREQLMSWLKGNTTGGKRMLAGVPRGWQVADKTGTGSYGTTNDIGILLPPGGGALVTAIYFTQNGKDAAPREDVIVSATRIVVAALS